MRLNGIQKVKEEKDLVLNFSTKKKINDHIVFFFFFFPLSGLSKPLLLCLNPPLLSFRSRRQKWARSSRDDDDYGEEIRCIEDPPRDSLRVLLRSFRDCREDAQEVLVGATRRPIGLFYGNLCRFHRRRSEHDHFELERSHQRHLVRLIVIETMLSSEKERAKQTTSIAR